MVVDYFSIINNKEVPEKKKTFKGSKSAILMSRVVLTSPRKSDDFLNK